LDESLYAESLAWASDFIGELNQFFDRLMSID
jgi:hypothetical protein